MSRDGGLLRIVVKRSGAVLATRASTARSLVSRMVGLLSRASLASGEGLVIERCRSIHMWFMRFPIDAVFVDGAWRVVALWKRLPPWRVTPVVWRATQVLELPAGAAEAAGVEVGDELLVQGA